MKRLAPIFFCFLFLFAAFTGFRFERTVNPGANGPNRLLPDVALLAGAASPSLGDLRFFDRSGREVAYLLVAPVQAEPRWKDGRILPVAATEETSGFEVDLGAAVLSDGLRLGGIPAPFLKRFRLEGSGDRSHWTLLVAEGTLFDLPDERLRQTEAGFRAGEFRYFRVTWDNRESGLVPPARSASARLSERLPAPPPLEATVEFKRLSAETGRSWFRIRLPGPHLPIAALEVAVSGGHLLRAARVTEARLSGDQVIPIPLGSAMLRRAERGKLAAADLRIPIASPEGREIEMVVEDGNTPPLSLTAVTVEFRPLPWIYFESADGAPLAARFGNSVLAAPRYDLEAMRAYLSEARPADAHWGDGRDLHPSDSVAESAPLPLVGAPIAPEQFRYSREIPAAKPGLASLALDAAVLAHSATLGDLRIADSSGHQIPYLFEKREEPLSLDLPGLAPDPAKGEQKPPGHSRYRLTLPYNSLPESQLVLTTTERVFERAVSVEITRPPADARSEQQAETVTEALWRHVDPETAAPALLLELRPLGVSDLRLVVDEGDNRPLPLSPVRLLLPSYRLRFFYPEGASLRLFYGHPSMAAPRYDLALLAPRLVGMSGQELSPAAEQAGAAPADKTAAQKKLFWGILIGAVVILLLLLVRLVRSSEGKAAV